MSRKIGSRYVAHRILGRGASGTVWQGEGPDGPVAIKLMREDLASDQILVARFVQERTALLSLEHPNIVGVHDLVVDGTDLALVMDLVHGNDLRQRLERDRVLAPQLALAIVADVAEGLAAAHAAGVIHRDVKPENILLDPGGGMLRARLTDFGIARLLDSPRRTRSTRIVGTPDYLAPEVIEGCQPTAAVDVYALGTVLFELLTGWTPFGGAHPGAVLRRHVTEPVPPIPGLPEPLAQLVMSCLSKAPAARLTAGEVAEQLRRLLPGVVGMAPLDVPDPGGAEEDPLPEEPAGSVALLDDPDVDEAATDTHFSLRRPTAPPAPVPPPPRSRRRRWIVGAAAALVLVVGGVAAFVLTRGNSTAPPPHPAGGTGVPLSGAGPDGVSTTPVAAGDAAAPRLCGAVPTWGTATLVGPPASPLAGGVRAVAVGQTTSFVFARENDGTIVYTSYDGTRFVPWRKLVGLHTDNDPAVVALGTTAMDVFAVDGTGALRECVLSGGTCSDGWAAVNTGAAVTGSPAAAATDANHVVVVATTVGGTLVAGVKTAAGWQPFQPVSTPGAVPFRTALTPAVTLDAAGRPLVVAVAAADGAVEAIQQTPGGTWSAPTPLGATSSARPELLTRPDGGILVLVRGTDGGTAVLTSVGGPPRAVPSAALGGGGSLDTPAVDVTGSGRVDLYTMHTDGHLYHAET